MVFSFGCSLTDSEVLSSLFMSFSSREVSSLSVSRREYSITYIDQPPKFLGFWTLHRRGFEVLDQGEEGVDVDGLRHEGEVAGGEGALAIFFARVARNRDGGDVAETGEDAKLFEKLVAVSLWHADVGDYDVGTLVDGLS